MMSISGKTIAFVVGAPKAGTFTLYNLFKQHTQISVSKMKEPNFFVNARINADGMKVVKREDEYLKQFDRRNNVYFEASPSYLRCKSSPAMIHAFSKKYKVKVKFIVVLRQPLERAFSNWLMDVRQGNQKKDFYEAVCEDFDRHKCGSEMLIQHEYYRASCYSDDIARYIKTFGANSVMCVLTEEIATDPLRVSSSIQEFLGVDHQELTVVRSNEAGKPRNYLINWLYRNNALRRLQRAVLTDSQKEFLRKMFFIRDQRNINSYLTSEQQEELSRWFNNDLKKLEKILSKDLSAWRYRYFVSE